MSCYHIYKVNGRKMADPVNSLEEFKALRDSEANKANMAAARAGDREAKRNLVQMAYNVYCPNGVLRGAHCPSDTFAWDYDEPQRVAAIAAKILDRKDELQLRMLERSTKGIHAVFAREQGKTILENQYRIACALGCEFDNNAHDIQRVMFSSTASPEDLLFVDERLFNNTFDQEAADAEYEELKHRESYGMEDVPQEVKRANKHCGAQDTPQAPAARPISVSSPTSTTPQTTTTDENNEVGEEPSYLGIPYSKIIQTWWSIHYGGREPVRSNRDTLTFELACSLRHICGFDRALMDKVIPCYDGFPQAEKMKCIDSALKEKITRMPPRLQQVLNAIKAQNADNSALVAAMDEAEDLDERFYIDHIPEAALPMGVRDSLEGVSRSMALPVLVGIGPMIGALATDVRLDIHGVFKRLNLMAYIVGEAASNKSQLDDLYLTWMEKLIDQDRVNHAIEDEYLEAVRRKKNSKDQPKDPHIVIRCESLRTSIAQLICRLRNCQGKHLYSYTSEADQLSQNSGNSWSNLSVLIRSAYDNSKFDTDYANGVSTGVVIDEVLWNMTLCCTPDALYRAHKNYTDGGITRLALARTPDNTFAPLTRMDGRSEQAKDNIRTIANLLTQMKGSLVLPELEKRCEKWLEGVRLSTLKNDDKVRARLRMRSAVTAMRYTCCFMLCGYAEWLQQQLDENDGEKPEWAGDCTTAEQYLIMHPYALEEQLTAFQTEDYLKLFDVMADYTLDMLDLFFRQRIENAYHGSNYTAKERRRIGANDTVFNRLPYEFSFQDAKAAKGPEASTNAAQQMLKNWTKQGLIEKIDKDRFRKKSDTK